MKTFEYEQSIALFERAECVIPGGVYGHFSPLRVAYPASYPLFAVEGQGSRFVDADGNEFIDYMCAYGPVVLGYANAVVEEAVRRQAILGDTLMGASPTMVELAEFLVESIPVASWAVFAKNGTDVITLATMIARSATGRAKIVAIEGGYHGLAPWMQEYGHPGITAQDASNTIRIPWNDVAAFERVLVEHPGDVAAFLSSPYHHPSLEDSALPSPGYWSQIRQLCTQYGVVLIVDDVRAGFRLDLRGSNEYFGFAPDLICFCKAIANGYPLAALVGIDCLQSEAARVRATGSYWFQAVPMAAALACVKELWHLEAPRRLADFGSRLTEGLNEVAAAHGFSFEVSGPPQIPYLRLHGDQAMLLHQRFCAECTRRGAYMVAGRNWQVSCAHSEADLQQTLEIADDVFGVLAREGAAERLDDVAPASAGQPEDRA